KVAGDVPGAHADLLDALTRAEDQGLPTLAWPAAAVLAELDAAGRERARPALVTIIDGLGERGPVFAARPDVAGLLGQRDIRG
ncbi:MAG TPA: hypothetical protein VIJ71_05655, partial [Mycobacteriales bacterium]